jgi:hypothetical protein
MPRDDIDKTNYQPPQPVEIYVRTVKLPDTSILPANLEPISVLDIPLRDMSGGGLP